MKVFVNLLATLLVASSTQAFAIQMLSYPVEQAPECNQSYDNTPEPKTAARVLSSLRQLCLSKGGVRVEQRAETEGNSNEPTDEIFSCIGVNPIDYTLFNCTFSSRDQP